MSIFDDIARRAAVARRRYELGLRRHRLTVWLVRTIGTPRLEDTSGQLAEVFAGALPDTLWREAGR